jgi:hypothetical protein
MVDGVAVFVCCTVLAVFVRTWPVMRRRLVRLVTHCHVRPDLASTGYEIYLLASGARVEQSSNCTQG